MALKTPTAKQPPKFRKVTEEHSDAYPWKIEVFAFGEYYYYAAFKKEDAADFTLQALLVAHAYAQTKIAQGAVQS